jgi:NitT/TauT family transport system ATP-binding protein
LEGDKSIMSENTFEIEAVYKWFISRNNDVLALENVSLGIQKGDFVTFVGPSGCGKSTLLNMVAGLQQPTSGEIRYHGESVSDVNTNVGYITQHDSIFPWRTVEANIQLPLEIRNVPKSDRKEMVQSMIDLVGLTGFEKSYPSQLSGGMRKRVGLARTLIYNPEALLLDEPFGALDAQLTLTLQAELLQIWERTHTTMVFVTHDLGEAIALSNRVVVFTGRPGKIKFIKDIDIPRPRDVFRMRFSTRFGELYEEIWDSLKEEVVKGEDL